MLGNTHIMELGKETLILMVYVRRHSLHTVELRKELFILLVYARKHSLDWSMIGNTLLIGV